MNQKTFLYRACQTKSLRSLSLVLLGASALPAAAQLAPAPSPANPSSPNESTVNTPETDLERLLLEGPFEAKGDPLQPLKGARTAEAPEEKAKKEREWFGQPLPYREWSRLTGDWDGHRTWLEDHGVAVGMKYTFDGSSVLSGGSHQRSAARGLLDLHVTIDLEPLIGLKGGTLFGQYYFRHGRSAADDVGSAQGFSNIDTERLSRAEEVWYEQKLAGDKVRLKIGQVDANAEYAFLEAASEFICPSSGFSPTIVAMPTYPDPALSANLFIYPTDQFYIGGGLYGQNFKQLDRHCFEHPFLIGEVGFTHGGEGHFAGGRLSVGGWRNTGDVDRFDGGVNSGTSGFYVAAEQVVWKEVPDKKDDAQGVSVFGQYGWADHDVSPFVQHFALGISSVGLIDGRDADVTGFRFSWVGLSREAGAGFDANESCLECFYKAQLTPAISIKPDLQWFHNPGGHGKADDALVASLRASFDF